jgi:SAM-dependent methyltransferase
MNPFEYDFGYSWPYAYGHVIPLMIGVLALIVALRYERSRWFKAIAAVVAVWGLAGLLITQFALRLNLPLELPTARFLANGEGRVLDLGAGSGRASLMVLLARPEALIVALDLFSNGYGISDNTPDRLRKNATTAGVSDRLAVTSADMREIPFPAASFDAVVTAYAIDHMARKESVRALNEIHRVLRPGGELLVEVMGADAYVHIAFPILGAHGFFGPNNAEPRWRELLEQSQFEILESGHVPGTVYVLARKPT